MKVFGELAVHPISVICVSVLANPEPVYADSHPDEIGHVLLDSGARVTCSADSARKLIAYFSSAGTEASDAPSGAS